MNPIDLIASRTRSRVVGATTDGLLSTFETVPSETCARLATSRMVTRCWAETRADQSARTRWLESWVRRTGRASLGLTTTPGLPGAESLGPTGDECNIAPRGTWEAS